MYFFGVLQELDDLHEFLARFIDTRDVLEANLDLVFRIGLGAALGKRHHAAFSATHPAEEHPPQREHKNHRQQPAHDLSDPAVHGFAAVISPRGLQAPPSASDHRRGDDELPCLLRVVRQRRFQRAGDQLGADLDRSTPPFLTSVLKSL